MQTIQSKIRPAVRWWSAKWHRGIVFERRSKERLSIQRHARLAVESLESRQLLAFMPWMLQESPASFRPAFESKVDDRTSPHDHHASDFAVHSNRNQPVPTYSTSASTHSKNWESSSGQSALGGPCIPVSLCMMDVDSRDANRSPLLRLGSSSAEEPRPATIVQWVVVIPASLTITQVQKVSTLAAPPPTRMVGLSDASKNDELTSVKSNSSTFQSTNVDKSIRTSTSENVASTSARSDLRPLLNGLASGAVSDTPLSASLASAGSGNPTASERSLGELVRQQVDRLLQDRHRGGVLGQGLMDGPKWSPLVLGTIDKSFGFALEDLDSWTAPTEDSFVELGLYLPMTPNLAASPYRAEAGRLSATRLLADPSNQRASVRSLADSELEDDDQELAHRLSLDSPLDRWFSLELWNFDKTEDQVASDLDPQEQGDTEVAPEVLGVDEESGSEANSPTAESVDDAWASWSDTDRFGGLIALSASEPGSAPMCVSHATPLDSHAPRSVEEEGQPQMSLLQVDAAIGNAQAFQVLQSAEGDDLKPQERKSPESPVTEDDEISQVDPPSTLETSAISIALLSFAARPKLPNVCRRPASRPRMLPVRPSGERTTNPEIPYAD